MNRDDGETPERTYRGRFAPSPTGPLHFGSLVAAVASYLDAKSRGGEWLLRIEDLDTDREQPGAADSILADLEHFGLEWDGPVVWQSRRVELYRDALERLRAEGLVYPCGCSRKEIADSLSGAGVTGTAYPGTCRLGLAEGKPPRSWRVRVGPEPVCFEDRSQGRYSQNLEEAVGDFVLLRADGPFAYQLAVVVDDAAQGITDVVRGADLLDSTPRQIHLQRLLGAPKPRYLHIPVVLAASGDKLSKQTGAQALDRGAAGRELCEALRFLGCGPPEELQRAAADAVWLREIWGWAVENWRVRVKS